MNDQQIDDLKQFLATTISQTETNLERKIETLDRKIGDLDNKVESLSQVVQDGFAGIGEAIEEMQNRYDAKNTDLDLRLTKLETKVA